MNFRKIKVTNLYGNVVAFNVGKSQYTLNPGESVFINSENAEYSRSIKELVRKGILKTDKRTSTEMEEDKRRENDPWGTRIAAMFEGDDEDE